MNKDYGKEEKKFHIGNVPLGTTDKTIQKMNALWDEATENLDLIKDHDRIQKIGELIFELADLASE